eukprot:TRINITY_DN11609_c0_g1_i15.p2 TRINITY_DN11609_c0_g1~~TRINITY_DN11609_c0_g1_i15.p2  ORF type:complete len:115 (+),score=0.96 TRINITY_DN11609_c0_g1_i15:312-656(+)
MRSNLPNCKDIELLTETQMVEMLTESVPKQRVQAAGIVFNNRLHHSNTVSRTIQPIFPQTAYASEYTGRNSRHNTENGSRFTIRSKHVNSKTILDISCHNRPSSYQIHGEKTSP